MTKASILHLIDRLQFPWLTAPIVLYSENAAIQKWKVLTEHKNMNP